MDPRIDGFVCELGSMVLQDATPVAPGASGISNRLIFQFVELSVRERVPQALQDKAESALVEKAAATSV